jgi:hypothetical protein
MRTVFVADSPAQAHLVAGLLEEERIPCVVEGEMLFGARGDLGLVPASAPKVCVRDEDAARAAEIIGARERRLAQAREDEDETAAPRAPAWRGVGFILVVWALLGVAATSAVGAVALPFAAVGLFVHLWCRLDRAS